MKPAHPHFAAKLALVLTALGASAQAAEIPRWDLSLPQAVQAALQSSARLKSAESAASAADSSARAQFGPLLPRLSLDGSYRYLTTLPDVTLPFNPALAFATHNNYSVGPAASFTLFDGGALYNNWRAAKSAARAQALEAVAIRRQLRLAARLTYFQALQASEQVRLLAESFRVESSQYQDIALRARVGSASQLDELSAYQQVLTRRRQLVQARGDLAVSIREMAALTRTGTELDASLPLDDKTPKTLTPEIEEPTMILALQPVPDVLSQMDQFSAVSLDSADPRLASLAELARSARLTAKSVAGSNWPTLSVLAKTTFDYPNGPVPESIHQNTFGAFLSFPLFTGGGTWYRVKEEEQRARSADESREQTGLDLERDWRKARDQLKALRLQDAINGQSVEAAVKLARLEYESYQAGRSRFLDVEDANLRLLQAKIESSRNEVQLLIQLANLESLSPDLQE